MSTETTYTCNLCRARFEGVVTANARMIGIHFSSHEWKAELASHSETHICLECVKRVKAMQVKEQE